MADEVYLEQLEFLHPKLRPYVKVLLTHEFGLLRDLPKIHSIQSGCIMTKNRDVYGDRFQLKICYCRKVLNWHVIMNGDDVTRAPDFIMEENFLADLTPETVQTKVPSLADWCPTNVRCLLNVVLELLQLYKDYQVNLLSVNQSLQRYFFEYDTLLSMAGMNKNEIEVSVQIRPPVVVFYIHLHVDFSNLPIALPESKDLVVLVVEFKDNAKNTIQLIPRVELDEALGRRFELPNLLPEMSLLDYIPRLECLLRNEVQKVIDHAHHRKMLYSYLVQLFEPALINGDNINFRKVFFLLEHENVYCVLDVNIPFNYPDHRPTVQFLPFFKTSENPSSDSGSFNYDRSMSDEEVARSIFYFAKERMTKENQKRNS